MPLPDREWNDFFAYDPRIKNVDARWFMRRLIPTAKERLDVENAVKRFLAEADKLFEDMSKAGIV